jgi:hypothetical protein
MFVLNVLRGESRPNNEAKFAYAESLKRVLRKGFPNRTFNMPRTEAHWAAEAISASVTTAGSGFGPRRRSAFAFVETRDLD